MPGISLEKFAEKSREDRFRMKALMRRRGLPEIKALAELYPKDPSNRGKKLKGWKAKKLWPIPAAEQAQHLALYNTIADQVGPRVSPKADTSAPLEDTQPISKEELQQALDESMRGRARHTDITQEEPSVLQKPSRGITQDVTSITQFDDTTVEALKEMAAWWRERKEEPAMSLAEQCPTFKRPTPVTRSVRIDKDLLQEAVTKAREEKGRTGGNFNSLVEVLLWEFLGRPGRFVEE